MQKSFPFLSATLSVAAAAIVSGCVVATRTPGPALYVDRAPPAAYSEAALASPGPGYVWIGGYYSWTGRDYYWNQGLWAQPQRGYTYWNQGYWHHDHRGHHWVSGRWR